MKWIAIWKKDMAISGKFLFLEYFIVGWTQISLLWFYALKPY